MPPPTSATTPARRWPTEPSNQPARTVRIAIKRRDHRGAGDQLPGDARGQPAFDPEMAAPVEDDVEHHAVEPGADGDRGGEAGDPERRDQGEIEHDVRDQDDDRDLDRGRRVLARVEAGRQHLDQHIGGQAEHDDRQGAAR